MGSAMGTWESYGIFEIYWDVHGTELLDAAKFAVYVLNVATEAPQKEVSSFFDLVRSQLVVENRTIVLNHHKNVLFHSGATDLRYFSPMGRYLMFRSVLHGCLCALGPRQILYLEMTANWPSTNYEALLRRLRSRVYDVKKATSFNVVSDGRDDSRSQATFGSGIQVDVVGGVITWNDVDPSFINKPDKKPESKS